MQKHFLLPGELRFATEPSELTTVLGSCVAVCLFDQSKKQGGMNHFMLPEPAGNLQGGKIADYAVRSLIKEALMARSEMRHLMAEIYGGGQIVTSFNELADIGERNIRKAQEILTQMKIAHRIVDVGGKQSRRIRLNTETGVTQVIKIDSTATAMKPKVAMPRVLVIDDSAMVRKVVRKAIEESGKLEVVGEAADAYEARERIVELDPDVLCLDVMMPGMNGLDFLRRVMYYKPIPTVVLSTLVREGNALWNDLKRAGALHMVNKDDLKIYAGTSNLQQVLIPKLHLAAQTVVYKIQPTNQA
jgi:two-component system chemotaxis response regulator CheB